jgi:hypothetical protein
MHKIFDFLDVTGIHTCKYCHTELMWLNQYIKKKTNLALFHFNGSLTPVQ